MSHHPKVLDRDYIVRMYLQGEARSIITVRLESDWEMAREWAAQFNATDSDSSSTAETTTYEGIILDFTDAENGRPTKWNLGVDDTLVPCVCWNQALIGDLADGDTVLVTGTHKTNQYGEQFVVTELTVTHRADAPF
jgi:hypothetical protein